MSLEAKINDDGKKKILTLDGGGVRGAITLEILAKIEELLREQTGGDENFVLADYFDYISGTSIGAIIAVTLSLGWPVNKIRAIYLDNPKQIFSKSSLFKRLYHSYSNKKLGEKLRKYIGAETTLGSKDIKTLLMIIMRNSTTNSPWPITNNPQAKFNQAGVNGRNTDIPLWQLVRASTAAPTYYPPEKIKVGSKQYLFVDGGVTSYNNPAFQAFLMSTLAPYNIGWKTGEKKMLLVSVGTGRVSHADEDLKANDMHLLYNAKSVSNALISASVDNQDLLCRTFGKCLSGPMLDLELGNLVDTNNTLIRPTDPLFTYVRYSPSLTRSGLDELGLNHIQPKDVSALDSVKSIPNLQQVGKVIADREVKPEHFSAFS